MKNSFQILCVCLALAVSGTIAADKCHMSELMGCSVGMMGLAREMKNSIPVDDAGIDKQCEVLKEMHDCMVNYSKQCVPRSQRDLITGSQHEKDAELVKEYCTPGSAIRTQYLQHASCLREASVAEDTKSCLRDVRTSLERSSDENLDQFELTCCTVNRFRECSEKSISKECGPVAAEFNNVLFTRSRLASMMKKVCSCYTEGTDSCNAVLMPAGTPPQGKKPKGALGMLYNFIEDWEKQE